MWRASRSCRAARRALSLRYYAALPAREEAALARHLSSCAACAAAWDALRRVLDAADPATVFPRETEVDWDGLARAAVARARAAVASGGAALPAAPSAGPGSRPLTGMIPAAARWAGLAAAALVVATLWTLSLLPPRPVAERAGPAAPDGGLAAVSARESARVIEGRLARRSAARYLSDSRALLMDLVQAPVRCRKTGGEFDISLEKEKSRQLLRRKNLYEGDLDAVRDQRLAALVRQLESVLIQVASLQDCASVRQLHELREQIEQRQILLRIDLVTREIRGRADVV